MSRPLTDHEWRRLELARTIQRDACARPDDMPFVAKAYECADMWIAAARLPDAPEAEQKTDCDVLVDGVPCLDFRKQVWDHMLDHLAPGARYRVTFTRIEEKP